MSSSVNNEARTAPRVVVVGLASCFGCQVQITNIEKHLLDVLGQIDLRYWQLASSEDMPDEYDVAVVEGAVTTEEAEATLREVREKAKTVIALGACAVTGGIPGMAAPGFFERPGQVYDRVPDACGHMIAPRAVHEIIPVDFNVRCCPVDPYEFVDVLQRALYGSNRTVLSNTICGECKRNESMCFYAQGKVCLGMVTTAGCQAKCVNLGRPCKGCRGLSDDANLVSARAICDRFGIPDGAFDEALTIFNQTNPVLADNE